MSGPVNTPGWKFSRVSLAAAGIRESRARHALAMSLTYLRVPCPPGMSRQEVVTALHAMPEVWGLVEDVGRLFYSALGRGSGVGESLGWDATFQQAAIETGLL